MIDSVLKSPKNEEIIILDKLLQNISALILSEK